MSQLYGLFFYSFLPVAVAEPKKDGKQQGWDTGWTKCSDDINGEEWTPTDCKAADDDTCQYTENKTMANYIVLSLLVLLGVRGVGESMHFIQHPMIR